MQSDNLKEYAQKLDPSQIGEVVLFGTGGSFFTIEKGIGKILKERKIPIDKKSLFLHGLMPKLGNFSSHQKEEITSFADSLKGAAHA